jgi:RNA-binding protein
MDELPLTGAQKTWLRGQGQRLTPSLKLGRAGYTADFFRELERQLQARELVKLRFLDADRDERAAGCARIASEGCCQCIGAVGHTALFFRRHPDPERRVLHMPTAER